jgi:hypothetical protein
VLLLALALRQRLITPRCPASPLPATALIESIPIILEILRGGKVRPMRTQADVGLHMDNRIQLLGAGIEHDAEATPRPAMTIRAKNPVTLS